MIPPPPGLPRTARVIEEGIADRQHLGVQVHVFLGGKPLGSYAFGERRAGEAMTEDTLLLWRSAGKPITALAIAQQWERGRLDLLDPVARHLPEFASGGKDRILIQHLLTHTAGFRTADALPETLSWPEMIAAVCQTPLERGWTPGVDAAYQTQSSWFVLGEIVQRLDGRPFPRYLREEVLGPLGMDDSWIGLPSGEFDRYGPRIGTTHVAFPGEPTPHPVWDTRIDCARCRPGNNARGPIADLSRFYAALLQGGEPVVRPKTLCEFTRRHRSGLFDRTFQSPVDFGLGFVVNAFRAGAREVPYNYGRYASPETFGHSGAQSTCAFADPQCRLAVAWCCNGLPGERRHQRRQRELNEAIYLDLGLDGASARPRSLNPSPDSSTPEHRPSPQG